MKTLEKRDQILHVNLEGRDPDDGFTRVPYVKGALFLRRLEEVFTRERFDAFLRGYFQRFAFRSITTDDFVEYLNAQLLSQQPDLAGVVDIKEWIYEPGLPAAAPEPQSDAFEKVEAYAQRWSQGEINAGLIPVKNWTTQEWLHFLRSVPEKLSSPQMATLDRAFRLSETGNSEILFQWLLMSVRNDYQPAYPKLKEFLTTVGRRKYLKPLYEELVKTPQGRKRAAAIYETARSGYHPIAVAAVNEVFSGDQPAKK
ncbi:MAG: leukotriene A4 hydrolase C-terminal domain-containing protein [Bryobacteraceae bacterium]